jgi:ketosteroid isomerase-like protein
VERRDAESWVERYVRAWETNDADDIGSLFTDDARYFTAPHRVPWSGREGIVEGWLDRKDDRGTWGFRWEVQDVIGQRAYVRGVTTYPGQDPPEYANLWVIDLAPDGRCSEFTEWWMAVD